MPGIWIDLRGPIVGTTAYDGGKLVGRDVTINLPAVTPVTADFKAMGTLTPSRAARLFCAPSPKGSPASASSPAARARTSSRLP